MFAPLISFPRTHSRTFPESLSDIHKQREVVTGTDATGQHHSWNGSAAALLRTWCTLPRQLWTQKHTREYLKWQQLKLVFLLKKRWRESPRPLFWKQNDSNETNLCIYLLPIAFLRFREHSPCGAAEGHELYAKCFCGVKLTKDARVLSSCFRWHFL